MLAELAEIEGRGYPSRAFTIPVRIVRQTLIDVTYTSTAEFHTGIQRVVREAVIPWNISVLRLEVNGNSTHANALSNIADFTDSKLNTIGHDLIPCVHSQGCAIAGSPGFRPTHDRDSAA